MPQPRPPRKTPPQPPPRIGAPTAGAAAAGAAAVPAGAALAAPSVAGAKAVKLSAEAVAKGAKAILDAFAALLKRRGDSVYAYTVRQLTKQFPDQAPDHLAELAGLEVQYEREFQAKVLKRLQRDLPDALRIVDPIERRKRIEAILARERRILGDREQAMLVRSQAAAEMTYLEKSSPEGAYWQLSEHVKEHTPDCLALGEKFWPWEVLRRFHPPMHQGCPCRLRGKDEAIRMGLMTEADVPDLKDALRRADRIQRLIDGLEEVGVDERDVEAWLEELQEAELHTARWGKGTTKGGEFRPKRGGDPGRPTLRGVTGRGRRRALSKLLPHLPKSPAERRGEGRWSWINGRLTRVPEERWRRSIGGHDYSSPAGSTNLYRDGVLVHEEGGKPTHPDVEQPARGRERRAPATRTAAHLDEKLRSALTAANSRERDRVRAQARAARVALNAEDPFQPPVAEGDGTIEAIDGLRAEGFHLAGVGHRGRLTLTHPTGAVVRLDTDRGVVAGVGWEPAPKAPPQRRVRAEGAPKDFDAARADALALADELGKKHDVPVVLSNITSDLSLGDHAGGYSWGGVARTGPDVEADLTDAAKALLEGRKLTDFERRGVYASHVALFREALRGVNPLPPDQHSAAQVNLENALDEELAHQLARERLAGQDQIDVVAWANEHPDSVAVEGGYRRERAALARLLDDAGLTGDEGRVKFVEQLKYSDPRTRLSLISHRLWQRQTHGDGPDGHERAVDHVEVALEAPAPAGFDAPTVLATGEPAVPDVPEGVNPPKPVEVPGTLLALDAAGGPVVTAIAEKAIGGDQNARWELAHRAEASPDSALASQISSLGLSLDTVPGEPTKAGVRVPVPPSDNQAYVVARVAPTAAAATGIRLDTSRDGELGTGDGPFGRGTYFTSGSEASQAGGKPQNAYPAGVDLSQASLYRVADEPDAAQLEGVLSDIDRRVGDPAELADRLPADSLGFRDPWRHEAMIRQAWASRAPSRDRPSGVVMRLLGYDGVDTRHVPEFDTQARGSVLYPPPQGDFDPAENPEHLVSRAEAEQWLAGAPDSAWTGIVRHETDAPGPIVAGGFDIGSSRPGEYGQGIYAKPEGALDALDAPSAGLDLAVRLERPRSSDGADADHGDHDGLVLSDGSVVVLDPAAVRVIEPEDADTNAGGAVVNGRAGRWVWIRGTYRHIPHGEAWEEAVDGVRFTSPAGSTFVYRREGTGEPELVAKPRWNGHPDVRNPNRGGTTRGAPTSPQVVTPTPQPTTRIPQPEIGPQLSHDRFVDAVNARIPEADGAEVVPGVVFHRDFPQPAGAAKLEDGSIIVGPSYFDLSSGARAFQLDRVLGLGLAQAIERDDGARQTFGDLWTAGAFQGERDGRPQALDRFWLPEAIGQAYARLRTPGWQEQGDRYPAAMRAVALAAVERGYPLDPEVRSWALGLAVGGTPRRHDVSPEAARLVGRSLESAYDYLGNNGWLLASSQVTGGPRVYRKFEPTGVSTIEVPGSGRERTDVLTAEDVTARHRPFNPEVAPTDDPPAQLAFELRGKTVPEIANALTGRGYANVTWGNGRNGFVHPDHPDQILWVGGSEGTVVPDVVDSNTRRLLTIRRLSLEPQNTPVGTDYRDVDQALRRGGWRVESRSSGPGAAPTWIDGIRNVAPGDSARAEVYRVRFRLENGRVVEAGRPGPGTGDFTTPELYAIRQGRESAEERERLRARASRITAVAEQVRVRINSGRSPFDGNERLDEVEAALRTVLGFSSSSPRPLRGGGFSTTWKNRETQTKIIVRHAQRDGVNVVDARARVTRGALDYGRARVTGRAPTSVDEYKGDILGRIDELVAQHPGAATTINSVIYSTNSDERPDHSGLHRAYHGNVEMGVDVRPSLQRLIDARAAGRPLTQSEMRNVYAAYKVMQHEGNHAVHSGGLDYAAGPGGKGIEEALTEELAHVELVSWLHSHGLNDVVDWAERERGDGAPTWPVSGSYQKYRSKFAEVLTRLPPMSNDEKVALFRKWKFEMGGSERQADIARRIAAHEGRSDHATIVGEIQTTMAGDIQAGAVRVIGFRPLLEPDFTAGRAPSATRPRDRPALQPTSSPSEPLTGARERVFRVGEAVRVSPVTGRRFQGRVIAVGEGDRAGQVQVRKIGRGEVVWAHTSRTTYVDGTVPGGTPTTTTTNAPTPTQTTTAPATGPTWNPQSGGMIAAGARVRGLVSGNLATVTSIERGHAVIRRDNGSTHSAHTGELQAIVVTDGGDELKQGDEVVTPDGARASIREIRWVDPARPQVRLAGVGESQRWFDARSLRPHGANESDATVTVPGRRGDVQVPVTGDVRLAGAEVKLTGQRRVVNWPGPNMEPSLEVKYPNGTTAWARVADLRPLGEQPSPPSDFRPDQTVAQRLGTQHQRRTGTARRSAQELAAPLSARIGRDLAEWARSSGALQFRRPGGSAAGAERRPVYRGRATAPSDLFALAYRDAFASEDENKALQEQHPRLYEAVRDISGEAGLPWPDWSTRAAPAPPLPPTPAGSMYSEAVLRHAWTGTFGRNGFRTEVTDVSAREGYASIIGRILDRSGREVGNFTRRVERDTDGTPTVYHALLEIQRGHRGGGFAKDFNRHAEGVYRAKGVKKVTVTANIDVGGYAWAATGFDLLVNGATPEERARARARKMWSLYQAGKSRLTAAERSVVERTLWNADTRQPPFDPNRHPHHAWDLAFVGGGDHALGKKILLGSFWSGIKHLVGPERSPFAG